MPAEPSVRVSAPLLSDCLTLQGTDVLSLNLPPASPAISTSATAFAVAATAVSIEFAVSAIRAKSQRLHFPLSVLWRALYHPEWNRANRAHTGPINS